MLVPPRASFIHVGSGDDLAMRALSSPSQSRSAPQRVVVVFDDTCGMCWKGVRLVRAFDWLHRFRFVGYFDAFDRYPEIAGTDMDEGVRARFPDASVTVGIDAVRSIAMRTPLGVLVAWTLYIPPIRWVARKAYCWVAARRHTTCKLNPSGHRNP